MKISISSIVAARAFVAFVGACELFGQLFFGTFSAAHSVVGVGAMLLSLFNPEASPRSVLALATVSGLAVLVTAYDYYSRLDVPGNNFAWPMRAPFLLALAFVAWRAFGTVSSQRRLHEG